MFKNKMFGKANKASKQQPVFKQDYFNNCHRTYSCIHCRAHLANHDELISKLFQGNNGRAYLFNKVVNIGCKQAVQRELLTGLHAVADIYCDSCETTLGWKYEQAFVPSQKYKEGKYIIELVHMLKENNWDLTSYNAGELLEDTNNSQGNLIHYNDLTIGDCSIIRTLNCGMGAGDDDNQSRGREACSDSSDTKKQVELDNPAKSSQNETATKVKQQVLSTVLGQYSENNEDNAPIEVVELASGGIELLERSIGKLELNLQENNSNNNNNNINANNSDSKTPRIQMVSPNNSLCSSHSQSNFSSSLSRATDSCSTDGETAPKSNSNLSEGALDINVGHLGLSENSTNGEFVDKEKHIALTNGDSTTTGISTSTTQLRSN